MHAPKKSTYSAVEHFEKIEIAALFAHGSRLGTEVDELRERIGLIQQHARRHEQNQHRRA